MGSSGILAIKQELALATLYDLIIACAGGAVGGRGRGERLILTLGKDALSDVAGVSLAEDGVAVTGDDTAAVEGVPEVLGDGLVAEVIANLLLHLGEPLEHLL